MSGEDAFSAPGASESPPTPTPTRNETCRLRDALERIDSLSDYELRDLLRCGPRDDYALAAAIATGRQTPPDLAGDRSGYAIWNALPWWPAWERERARHQRRLLALCRLAATNDRA